MLGTIFFVNMGQEKYFQLEHSISVLMKYMTKLPVILTSYLLATICPSAILRFHLFPSTTFPKCDSSLLEVSAFLLNSFV